MSLYTYVKEKNSVKKRVVSMTSYIVLTMGAFLLFWSFYPVVAFEVYSRLFIKREFVAPIPSVSAMTPSSVSNSVGSYSPYSNNLRDFTQASLWFPDATKSLSKNARSTKKLTIKQYSLSIPKLSIDHAKVFVGGEDLTQGLVQYLPTSYPGEYGNIAIFGHSTLPQLYNPKDYKSIFTYLPSLEKGDRVTVHFDGFDYEYQIDEMFVIKPEQVSILEQRYDASYITLVTCVPPGTYWNRLVLRGKLTSLPTNL